MSESLKPSLKLPYVLDSYELVRIIGAGGFAEVYEARHVWIQGKRAVKILRQTLASDDDEAARFWLEAMVAGQLNHPNLVACWDAGKNEERRPWLAMELIKGMTLAQACRRGPLPVRQVLRIGADLTAGLGAAHRKGIIHRDVKPANCFWVRGGPAKIGDFGLFHAVNQTVSVNDFGKTFGTAPYMAPEQLLSDDVDARADMFGLGHVLAELLLGRHLLEINGRLPTYKERIRLAHQRPIPLPDLIPGFPGPIWEVLAKAIANDRSERYGSMADFGAALSELAEACRDLPDRAFPMREGRAVYLPDEEPADPTDPSLALHRDPWLKTIDHMQTARAHGVYVSSKAADGPISGRRSISIGASASTEEDLIAGSSVADAAHMGPSAPADSATPTKLEASNPIVISDPFARWNDPTAPAVPAAPVSASRARPREARSEPTLALGTMTVPHPSRRAPGQPQVSEGPATADDTARDPDSSDTHDTVLDPPRPARAPLSGWIRGATVLGAAALLGFLLLGSQRQAAVAPPLAKAVIEPTDPSAVPAVERPDAPVPQMIPHPSSEKEATTPIASAIPAVSQHVATASSAPQPTSPASAQGSRSARALSKGRGDPVDDTKRPLIWGKPVF